MRTADCPRCPLCSAQGTRRYTGLRDRLFSAPGEWNLSECPNPKCGILWLDPMPLKDDLGEAYADYFTHETSPTPPNIGRGPLAYFGVKYGYRRSPDGKISPEERRRNALLLFSPLRRSRLDCQVFFLPKPAGEMNFLDVGCGNGQNMAFMSGLGWNVEGVEIDPAAVEAARARGLTVHQGALPEQQFSADRFDALGLSHVIEHVHQPVDLLAECRRILKPGGTVVAATPNVSGLGHRIFGSNWIGLDPPRHLNIFTPPALAQAARSAGFKTFDVFTSSRLAPFTAITSTSIRRSKRAALSGHGRLARRASKLFEAIEFLALQFNRQVGEEIFLMATKD